MASNKSGRDVWGSGLGFVLAASGSAIGLGNIWGFPYMAAQSGGGAFVALYVVCVVVIGFPVLLAELSIGRSSQKSPVGAFAKLAPGTPWPALGAMGVTIGFAILSFYSVIAGWTLGYFVKAVSGQFAHGIGVEESQAIFDAFRDNSLLTIGSTTLFYILTILVVRGGIRAGIERVSKILMPIFFVLLVLIAIRSLTLEGAEAGVHFLFKADFTKLTPTVVLNALAQALFSLSLGMGAMITYGSYLRRDENLVVSGATVATFDTVIALLAGVMIFPALFAAGVTPDKGEEGLVFVVLPTIFDTLPLGNLFAVAFYALLGIAALTSSISLLEVVASYFIDERGWTRNRAAWTLGLACLALAVPSALSGRFMGLMVQIFYVYLLAVGALLICLFAGYRWGVRPAREELGRGGGAQPVLGAWSFLIRFVCPVVAAAVLGYRIYTLVSGWLS